MASVVQRRRCHLFGVEINDQFFAGEIGQCCILQPAISSNIKRGAFVPIRGSCHVTFCFRAFRFALPVCPSGLDGETHANVRIWQQFMPDGHKLCKLHYSHKPRWGPEWECLKAAAGERKLPLYAVIFRLVNVLLALIIALAAAVAVGLIIGGATPIPLGSARHCRQYGRRRFK